MTANENGNGNLPEDRWLASVAVALNEAGHFAEIVDREWRAVYQTDASRAAGGFLVETAPSSSRAFMFGPEQMESFASLPIGSIALDFFRARLQHVGEWVISDLGGGREQLRSLVDPRLEAVVDQIVESGRSSSAITYYYDGYGPAGSRPRMVVTAMRIHQEL